MALAALFFAAQVRTVAPRKYVAAATAAAVVGTAAYAVSALIGWSQATAVHYAASFALTGLSLLQLGWLADADATSTGAALLADAVLFAAGYATTLLDPLVAVAVAFATGFGVLAVLFTRLSASAGRMPGETAALFSVLRNLGVLVWLGYPLVWLLGLGFDTLPTTAMAAMYLVVDLLAVTAFGALLLRSPDLLTG